MAGIPIMEHSSGETRSHRAVWTGPEEVPVVFIVVKDDSTAIAHPDYIGDILYEVDQGDFPLAAAWDFLMVKTPKLSHPQICRVRRLTGTGGGAEILIGNRIVHRIEGVGK